MIGFKGIMFIGGLMYWTSYINIWTVAGIWPVRYFLKKASPELGKMYFKALYGG